MRMPCVMLRGRPCARPLASLATGRPCSALGAAAGSSSQLASCSSLAGGLKAGTSAESPMAMLEANRSAYAVDQARAPITGTASATATRAATALPREGRLIDEASALSTTGGYHVTQVRKRHAERKR